jgi:uncharacterized protein
MNPIDILEQYYDRNSKVFEILTAHGSQVARKALKVAENVSHLEPDLDFIEKAAMLHDVGIFLTDTPQLGCNGTHPYIRHGVLGYDLLIEAGRPRLARVCERHVGVGISADDVLRSNLPLPERDMVPISIEEQIICYADKFFSKNGNGSLETQEKNLDQIIHSLQKYGPDKVHRFQKWVEMFEDQRIGRIA